MSGNGASAARQPVISRRAASLFLEFGMVSAAISELGRRPPVWKENTFDEYLASLGPKQPDELAIMVKVSMNGTHSLKNEGEHEYAVESTQGLSGKKLSLLEVPQDFFYLMRGLHRGAFEIAQGLPPYFYGMGILQLHTLFEVYLEDLLRVVYESNPSLMPAKLHKAFRQFDQASNHAAAKEAVEDAAREALRLPILAVVQALRERFGFTDLPTSIEAPLQRSTLIRNSIAHGAVVSGKLAAACPHEFRAGETLAPTAEMLGQVERALRECAFGLELARPGAVIARQEPAFGNGLGAG